MQQAAGNPESPLPVQLDLTVDQPSSRDVLGAIVQAVLFHRLFGSVQPRHFDVLDVTFPGVSDPEVDRLVSDKMDALRRGLEEARSSKSRTKQAKLVITFFERRPKKTWFLTAEEEVPWETWTVNANILSPQAERDPRDTANLKEKLQHILLTILTHTSSERGRTCVPPIQTAGVLSPFAYSIGVFVGGVEHGGTIG